MTTGPWDPDELVPDDEWVRPVERNRPAPPPGQGPAPRFGGPPRRDPTDPRGQQYPPPRDPTDPRGQPAARRRPATGRSGNGRGRGARLGLPVVPTLAVVTVVVVLAFVLGRLTGGGGDDGDSAVRTASAETTTTTEEVTKHTVKSGESLLGIASQYGVTAEALAAANGINNQNHVFVGQVLTIPPSSIEPIATTTTPTTKPAEG